MKINLLTEVANLDGTPIPEGANGKPMTLRSVFCSALVGQKQGEVISGIEKVRRYNLATQIFSNDKIDLGIDDIKLLRDLVADGYIPLIVGQVWNILDPPSDETPEEPPEQPENGVTVEKGKI